MNVRHVSRLLRACFALGCALAASAAAAADWPVRPVRLVVPFVAGGGADVAARLIALKVQERLGQPIIVENKAGGNTLIGVQEVLRAPPDGYTLLWSIDQTFVLNPALYEKLPYDPKKDFTPISLAVVGPNAVVARSQHSIRLRRMPPRRRRRRRGSSPPPPPDVRLRSACAAPMALTRA